jgi:hypothetical protein
LRCFICDVLAAVDQNEDAISLLTADHAKVKKLFEEFAALREGDGSAEDKSALVSASGPAAR